MEKGGNYEIEVGKEGERCLKVGEFTVYFDEKLEKKIFRAVLDFDCFFSIRFE